MCCFTYGFGARMVPCCLEIISCDEYEVALTDPLSGMMVGGGKGKFPTCPTDAGDAHFLVTGEPAPELPMIEPEPLPELVLPELPELEQCCFTYGFGAMMVPCCLEIISCDEYEAALTDPLSGMMLGGGKGKFPTCPTDAPNAHYLVTGK